MGDNLPMQVFVVFNSTDWDGGVFGVFSTHEKAMDAVLEVMGKSPSGRPDEYFIEVTLDRAERTAFDLQQAARERINQCRQP